MTRQDFGVHVEAALFDARGRAAFALGDGTVRFETGEVSEGHDGAILCAERHPSGEGVLTGGDDGRLVWSRPDQVEHLMTAPAWVDAVAAAPASGLIALAAGRTVTVLDSADPAFRRSFAHERSVSGLAFDPKGRRLAAATYGAVALWFARIAEQKPTLMKWPGAHQQVVFSPDGRFLIAAQHEPGLHGWRLSDAKDMRMAGYPARVRSLTFLADGALLATAGASGAVLWPFSGANGPLGRQAVEIGQREGEPGLVRKVAAMPGGSQLAAGLDDGRVWLASVDGTRRAWLREEGGGAPISALALSDDGRRLAWGDEAGATGLVELA